MNDLNSRKRAEIRGGTVDEGLANGRALLESHPEAALQQAQALLRSGMDPRALHLAAEALRRLDKQEQAEQCELSAIKASFAIPALDVAAVAGRDGRAEEAAAILERFVREQPDNILAATMLAELEMDDWQLGSAEQRLRGVLRRAPSFLRAIMLLAKCLTNAARVEEAIAIAEGVLARKPQNRTALRSLAQMYAEINEHSNAADLYLRLLEVDPANVETRIIYAQELRILGRKKESMEAFRRVIAAAPQNGAAWWGLTYYFPTTIDGADVGIIERSLAGPASPQDRAALHIAMSILKEKKGDFAGAFHHVAEGKRLRSSAQPYDASAASAEIDQATSALSSKLPASAVRPDFEPKGPIFIVGMPRSGTTLLERILGSHSQIEACGELPIMPRVERMIRDDSRVNYSDRIANLGESGFRELGQRYLESSRAYRKSDKARFIDKLNFNWTRAGLIRLVLPEAQIIDLRRDALDCCWSNFKMMFSEGHPASNDQRDIALFYRDYVRTIEAIKAAAPDGILRVRYEDLVEDAEQETRRILLFLGLEYETQCMDYHLSTAAVATPSSEQVRRRVNREGVGSADPYREWLGPMIEALGPLACGQANADPKAKGRSNERPSCLLKRQATQ